MISHEYKKDWLKIMSSIWTTAGTWLEISTKSHQVTRTSNVMQFSVVFLPSLVRPPIVTEQPILVMRIVYDCFLRNEKRIKPAVSWWDKIFPLWPHAFFTRVIILHYQIILQFQLEMNCFLHQMNFRSRSSAACKAYFNFGMT